MPRTKPAFFAAFGALGNSFQLATSIARLCGGEIAGIVDLVGDGLVGHRLRRNEFLRRMASGVMLSFRAAASTSRSIT